MDSRFEWAAHEPEALKVGVPQNVVDVIKYRKSTAGLSELDAAIVEFGRQAVGKHKVDPAAFARLKALFAPEQLVDLVLLMGNYAGTAILLAAFDMQVAEGRPLLPVE
jgi:4-carboxymuconolactone decarboxylase